uniref:Rab GTPase-binding effector protein 1 n=1 Tax=Phallusia mammillata TaxID=59560 RepID=A0A6F9DPM2_9ASCI|nr:rab GTPase-binding effector protein 1 [Phallusia mammillata]
MVFVMDAQPMPTQDEMMRLRSQLADTERRFALLQQEKVQMESDFEYKRSKIKELYYAKENMIRDQNSKLLEASKQISQLESTVTSLREEIENVKMIASVSENTKQEAVEDLKKHHLEEIESLKCVLQDTFEDQRRDLIEQFGQERQHWEQEKEKILHENTNFKELLSKTEGSLQEKEKALSKQADQELETSMMMAQSEAENLKSVVLPLEQEIADLKEKLRIADEDIIELRRTQTVNHKEVGVGTEDCEDVSGSDLNTEVRELSYSLQSEKSSRTDLELYVEVLSRQKTVLQQENDILKREMHEVCRSLEQEQSDHLMLKQTWNRANEHFMLSQDQLMNELNAAKACLAKNQLNQIKSTKRVLSADGFEVVSSLPKQAKDVVGATSQINGSAFPDSNSFGSFQNYEKMQEPVLAEPIASPATELQDTISISSVSSVPEAGSLMPNDELRPPRVNSAPLLTLTNADSSTTQNQSDEIDNMASPTRHLKLLRVKETEIETLKQQVTTLEGTILDLEKKLAFERESRLDVEESVMRSSEDAQKQIRELTGKIHNIEVKIGEDKTYRKNKEAEDNEKLLIITADRENLRDSYLKLKKEQDAMRSSFMRSRQSLQKDSSTPTSMEGLRISLDKYKEAFAIAQVEKNSLESTLRTRISLLESTIESEKMEKEQMEAALLQDVEEARNKVSSLQSLQTQLIKETNQNKELQIQVEKDQLSMESIRSKSREIIKGFKEKLRIETSEKEALESKLADAKNQLRSLQESLETSELVQRDFVKLSQSLQVQLEEIRLKEEASSSKQSQTKAENHSPSTEKSLKSRNIPD